MSGLKVNFSSEEASSEARSYKALPTGQYNCAITNVDTKQVKEEGQNGKPNKNAGKPYWNVEFTVQDGEYADSKCWGTVMLFEGALYSLAQILKATGYGAAIESGEIPSGADLEGKKLIVVGTKKLKYKSQDEYQFEVKGYKSENDPSAQYGSGAPSSSSAGSLLP